MARISFTMYNNSIPATLTDLLGSSYVFLGCTLAAGMLFENDPEIGTAEKIISSIAMLLILVFIGVGHKKAAERMSERKKYKQVIKKIKANGFESKIRESAEFAAYVYRKFPDKMIKKYVVKLNPASKDYIMQAENV